MQVGQYAHGLPSGGANVADLARCLLRFDKGANVADFARRLFAF